MADNTIRVLLTAIDQVTGPMGAASKSLESFGKQAESIGKKLEGLGLRIGGMGTAAQAGLSRVDLDLKTLAVNSVDVEKALYGIAITAGQNGAAATAMVGQWSTALDRISVDTNRSKQEIVAAFGDLIAKGMDPKAAIQQLTAIGKTATGATAEVQNIASAANAALQNMGVESSRSLEIMAQAGKSGAFELRDMAAYFDLLTVKSSLLGQKGAGGIASLAAAAQIARKGAGDASTAANNLANFLDKLTAPVTAKAFEKFGVNLASEMKAGLASGDVIGFMAERIQQITGGDAAKLSELFSDVQAKNFIAPMLQNLEEYKRIRTEALGASGVVDADFATAMQSTAAQIDAMKASVTTAINRSGALSDITTGLKGISQWVAENPDLAKWVIFGTAGMAVGGAAIVGIGAMVTAIGTISTAVSGLAIFLAANPVVLAILGVAAAGAAGYAFGNYIGLDEVGKKLGFALYDIVQSLKKGWKTMSDTVSQWKQLGINIIDGLWEGIKATMRKPLDAIGDLAKKLPAWAKDLLGIKSPSRVFATIGEQIGAGLVVGINTTTGAVEDAASDLAQSAIDAADVVPVAPAGRMRTSGGQFVSRETQGIVDAVEQSKGPVAAGFAAYAENAGKAATNIRNAFERSFKGLEDALLTFVKTGKLNFRSLADSIISDMMRIAIQESITKPLAGAMSGINWGSLWGSFTKSANGNIFASAGLHAYANQIVSRPTLFPFARGVGLMGEAGPEAIMPLKRGPDGRLGVSGAGGSVQVNVYNNATGTTQATARERSDGQGNRIIDVLIEQVQGAIAGNISRGAGPIPAALGDTYGLNRVAGAY